MNLPVSEPLIRLGFFVGVLVVMALWELAAPRRRLTTSKPLRWLSNLGLAALNTAVLRLLLPMGAVGVALLAEARGWGLLNNLPLPAWVAVPVAVIVLDLAIYLQHVMFHAVPVLWRLHMVHHADLDFDFTTGVRFHTAEMVLSLGIKLAVVLVLGPPALAVLIFEVLLNATSMFNHANVRMPAGIDRVLRLVLVTPDMHRVHHSVNPRETNSNFGFNLPWWDFLFGTYRARPAAGHEAMTIGLSEVRDERRADRLHWMLALPLLGEEGNYPINRRGASVPADRADRQQPLGV
ncbi:MAG TPA: sterol desaturase family protein [Gemmataceae bacterium]|nr:sterol desaturase family protein [Gemmataceae bacterium]